MRTLTTPRPPTNSARLWTVDLGPAGTFTFRFPSYAVATRIGRHIVEARPEGDPATTGFLLAFGPTVAVAIGACWWAADRELSTPWPTRRDPRNPHAPPVQVDPSTLTREELTAYGMAVVEELQDLGWNPLVVAQVGSAAIAEINKRTSIATMAAEVAGFFQPQAEGSISS